MSGDKTVKYARSMISNYNDDLACAMCELGKKESDHAFRFFYLPLADRRHITWAIDHLDKIGHDTAGLKNELAAVDKKFDDFKKGHAKEYFDLVFKDIKALTGQLDPSGIQVDCYEIDLELEKRTDIEILFEDLSDYYGMKDEYFERYFELKELYEDRVKGRDDVFRMEIERSKKYGYYSPNDHDIAPDAYWWLHLEEVYGTYDEARGKPHR